CPTSRPRGGTKPSSPRGPGTKARRDDHSDRSNKSNGTHRGLFLLLAVCLAVAGWPSRTLPCSLPVGESAPAGQSAIAVDRVASLAAGLVLLTVGSLICGLACYGTSISTGLAGYAIGLLDLNFCYLMLGPFALVGVPSALDASGRLAAAANGLMWLAYSVGVAVGGLIADRASVREIGTWALVGCI